MKGKDNRQKYDNFSTFSRRVATKLLYSKYVLIHITYFLRVTRSLLPTTLVIYLIKYLFIWSQMQASDRGYVNYSLSIRNFKNYGVTYRVKAVRIKLELTYDNLKAFITSNSCCWNSQIFPFPCSSQELFLQLFLISWLTEQLV